MTRKEVCKAVGITVKTLRLYEEKGLIVPEKEYRNGREYRDYSPVLVAQLARIVLLRRALFTMAEIKTMQSQPEKIPEIFRDYQSWLNQQARQFQQLKAAADMVRENSLTSVDDLISELRSTASKMPLPQMDIKPNFKRIDELEELPRHVEEQVNFDETVPSARVFRQMNLVMDRDKSNNINVAFGQVNELRKGIDWETTGPVHREMKMPKWYKILSGILSVLLVISFVIAICQGWRRAPWVGFVVLAVLRALWAAIPALSEHGKWVRSDRVDQEGRKQEQKSRKKIIILCIVGGILIVGLIGVLCWVLYERENPAADIRACFTSSTYIADEDMKTVRAELETLMWDADGNGDVVMNLDFLQISGTNYITENNKMTYRDRHYLDEIMDQGICTLAFVTDLNYYNEYYRDFSFATHCQRLPEDLVFGTAIYQVDLTGVSIFDTLELDDQPIYGCISKATTEEEYNMAVELLRQILAQ